MKKIKLISNDFSKEINVNDGANLLEAIHQSELFIDAPCGGQGKCGKCTVYINEKSYLACKINAKEDLTVFLPDYNTLSLDINKNDLIKKLDLKTFNPIIEKVELEIIPESRAPYQSDIDYFQYLLKQKNYSIIIPDDLKLLSKISNLSHSKNIITVYLYNKSDQYEIIDIVGSSNLNNLSLAIDIGTTTVSISLINLDEKKIIDSITFYNPQIIFGADIIHRIVFAQKNNGNNILKDKLVNEINNSIRSLSIKNHHSMEEIKSIAISGNTTMIHLFLGLPVKFIRESPYSPVLNIIPPMNNYIFDNIIKAKIFVIPGVANYLGGDIVSGVVAENMQKKEDISILIDIGTNGEIIIGNKDWLIGCACSAGPAFEGMGLSCGTRYKQGAITDVNVINNEFKYTIAGNIKPVGISGTGIISLLKHLKENKFIDNRGKFTKKVNTKIGNRKAFILYEKDQTSNNEYIYIDEIDIDNILRTKAAIYSGISLILKKLNFNFSNISYLFIAGGIGNSLNTKNALDIGLFPPVDEKKIIFIGNSSLTGTIKYIFSKEVRDNIIKISKKITYIDLSNEPGYMDEFMAALFIPHTDYL